MADNCLLCGQTLPGSAAGTAKTAGRAAKAGTKPTPAATKSPRVGGPHGKPSPSANKNPRVGGY